MPRWSGRPAGAEPCQPAVSQADPPGVAQPLPGAATGPCASVDGAAGQHSISVPGAANARWKSIPPSSRRLPQAMGRGLQGAERAYLARLRNPLAAGFRRGRAVLALTRPTPRAKRGQHGFVPASLTAARFVQQRGHHQTWSGRVPARIMARAPGPSRPRAQRPARGRSGRACPGQAQQPPRLRARSYCASPCRAATTKRRGRIVVCKPCADWSICSSFSTCTGIIARFPPVAFAVHASARCLQAVFRDWPGILDQIR